MQNQTIPEPLQKRLAELGSMRDELRVRLHLGGMDARTAWDYLADRLVTLEQRAREASGEAAGEVSQSLEKLAGAFKDLAARLERQPAR